MLLLDDSVRIIIVIIHISPTNRTDFAIHQCKYLFDFLRWAVDVLV